MTVEKYISPFIESQFPSFYQEEGPNFIAFVKAYYEWAEQQGNFLNLSRSLYDIKDIDSSPDTFLRYFKNKFISTLPESIIADKKLLVKHILELYRTKGTERSYELLFRILFNEDISFYIPGHHLFKPSEALWYVPKYIEVSDHPLLKELVGRRIYSSQDAFAVVENYFIKVVNNKTINILTLSSLTGSFKFNEQIYCDDFPEITSDNAPIVFGSLSSVSIKNGGVNFNVGDYLKITPAGTNMQQTGLVRVAATREQNGKVEFNLIDGGDGFSLDAIVSVTGGYGAGAYFQIGGITNKKVYYINKEKLDTYKNVGMEDSAAGFNYTISSPTGLFLPGDTVESVSRIRVLDVEELYSRASNNETFSNTALGISGIQAWKVVGNCIFVTGTNSALLNANLVSGAVLQSDISSSIIKINSLNARKIVTGHGTVVSANTSEVVLNDVTGFFVPFNKMKGGASNYEATIDTVTRLTDWNFTRPSGQGKLSNLDTPLTDLLTVRIFEAGRITFLKNINPGDGYSAPPNVTIIEPDIYDLRIPDGQGGYFGYNSVVQTKSGASKGIVSSVEVVDSGYGYNTNETVYLSGLTNQAVVTGVSVLDLNGVGKGYSKNNKSFLSDTINIQDSDYYQNYSYEIIASRMMETYEKQVKDLIHPSGMKMFGKYALNSYLINDNDISPVGFSIVQS